MKFRSLIGIVLAMLFAGEGVSLWSQDRDFRAQRLIMDDGNGNKIILQTPTGPITGGTVIVPDPYGTCTLVTEDGAGNVEFNGSLSDPGGYLSIDDNMMVEGSIQLNNDGQGVMNNDDMLITESGISYNSSSNHTFQIDNTGTGNVTLDLQGDLTISGTLTASNLSVEGAVPVGGIVMWSGSVASIPSGWVLCDGTNGTPDLRGRFIVGAVSDADATYGPGNVGGTASNNLSHTHTFAHTHTGTTSSDGSHTHTLATTGSVGTARPPSSGSSQDDLSYTEAQSSGVHTHTFTTEAPSTTTTSSSLSTVENRPPYYTLAYIMREF